MGIIPRFTKATVKAAFAKRMKAIDRAIINTLSYVGEQCVNQARLLDTYHDQTGNLRNSIGYVIIKDGKILKSNFGRSASVTSNVGGKTRKTKGSSDGVSVGRQVAEDLLQDYPRGYALIVVAGMSYATAVESRGLDVLTSAEQLAERIVPQLLADLKNDITSLSKASL